MEGVLSPLESGQFITENADLLKVDDKGVEKVAELILDAIEKDTFKEVEFAAHALHPKDGGRKAVDWVFFMDTVNFSFWPDVGKKYDVSYKGIPYTGYFAACAAVNKALDAGVDVTDAKWMATATKEDVDKLFISDSGHSIPLLDQRVEAINDSGRVLLEKWGGSFYYCIEASKGSAASLLRLIVENFVSFRDFAEYKGRKVSLLKRAQILIADVYGALQGIDPIGEFHDFGSLTMFADYRVPQALAFLGALDYSQELIDRLKEGKWLENGSNEEVQLRGASIWCCQKIVEAIDKQKKPGCRQVTASDVDIFVWVYRRKHAEEIEAKIPFHRTRCIYY